MLQELDEIRKDKKIKIKDLEKHGISKNKYYRLLRGETSFSLSDYTSLIMLLNITPEESKKMLFKPATFYDFQPHNVTAATKYTSYDINQIIMSINAIFVLAQNDDSKIDESLAILNTLKENKYISEFFPITIDYIDLCIASLKGDTTGYKAYFDKFYSAIMARDVWQSYELNSLFYIIVNDDFNDSSILATLVGELDKRYNVALDDYETIMMITMFRGFLFTRAVESRQISTINYAYAAVQHATPSTMVIHVATLQRYYEIVYFYLIGRTEAAEKNSIKLMSTVEYLYDTAPFSSRPETDAPLLSVSEMFMSDINELKQSISKWRLDLNIPKDYNLLTPPPPRKS
ncbi:hypothetical protein [Pseudolactococcus insecticola]|uniref:HTH cro/C1-type domain-containing protein n=1 Tax=Pseudolactococcus insecticola TaxID=2709158 RepID=A0A6A0B9A8_9LACT|nr:hypothetical protein [Lactococcus insecticola]GFH41038.1 hypothetical protein Hs20B_14360 [Lactococcus insecticola]